MKPRSDRRGGKRPGFRPRFEKKPRPGPVTVVHEDADVIVVDKPAGLLSSRLPEEHRENLFDMVKEHVRGEHKRPVRVWIVHRLDKEASGLLVFAKTEKAFNWLKEDLRAKRMHRLYAAVVEGEIGTGHEGKETSVTTRQLPAGTIQSFISDDEFGNVTSVGIGEVTRQNARDRRRVRRGGEEHRGRFMGPLDDDAPRLAVTHWRLLGVGQGRSLLQLRLDTGRKNQIRVHMKEFGHAIVGDARYGATQNTLSRLALHATELGFTHPGTGQSVRYFSPAPTAFFRSVGMEPPKGAPEPTVIAEAQAPAVAPAATGDAASTSWDSVAVWYDRLIEEERSDHFRHVIMPGTLRLLRPAPPMRVLDIACGQGALCRRLGEMGLQAVGVDASPRLIDAARKHGAAGGKVRFETGDARFLGNLPAEATAEPFDAATCVMALMNMDPLDPVLRGAASLLRPGGAFVAVILHPAFRAPKQTAWGWDERDGDTKRRRDEGDPSRQPRGSSARQYRRIDGYLSPGQFPITMNPGFAAHGAQPVQTWTFHRPVQTYVRLLAEAGFLVESLEEWPSMRKSQPGPRAAEEDRARREIPMFLGIRAVKR